MSLWFGPCLKRVSVSASRHPDFPDLVRVYCVPSRRIKTYKAGEEQTAVPGAWVRDHLCGECRRRKVAPVSYRSVASALGECDLPLEAV